MPQKTITALAPIALCMALGACGDGHTAQVARGQIIYERVCSSCHANKVGPSLKGIVGRRVASVPGYNYSDAMRASSGAVWTEDRIKNFVMGPLQMYPEGRMVITPLKPEEADDIVAFLKDKQQ